MSRPQTTLILSDQPVLAALLAMVVELAGHRPEFAVDGGRLEHALQRSPLARVALVDERHPAARSDLFFARAAKRGVTIILFGAPARREALMREAATRGIGWIQLPIDAAQLAQTLERTAAREPRDRRQPQLQRTPEGALVYLDREGARWYVYDRRAGADRRRSGSDQRHRLFVNEAGEMWRYRLRADDPDDPPADDIERQLARAERIEG